MKNSALCKDIEVNNSIQPIESLHTVLYITEADIHIH